MLIAGFLTAALIAAHVSALPADVHGGNDNAMCGAKPTGNGQQAPLSTPPAPTADDCKKCCDQYSGCQAFTFDSADPASPVCSLYGVPAASIPAGPGNAVAYDKQCGNVPAVAPRDAAKDPQGSGFIPEGPNPSDAPSKPAGPPPTGPPPTGPPPAGPPPTSPPPTSPPRNGEPSGDEPAGPPQSDPDSQPQRAQRRNVCGSPPSGPSGQAPAPLANPVEADTAQDCLALGQNTVGCQS